MGVEAAEVGVDDVVLAGVAVAVVAGVEELAHLVRGRQVDAERVAQLAHLDRHPARAPHLRLDAHDQVLHLAPGLDANRHRPEVWQPRHHLQHPLLVVVVGRVR